MVDADALAARPVARTGGAAGGLLGPRITVAAHRVRTGGAQALYARGVDRATSDEIVVELRPFAEFDGGTAMRVWMPTSGR
ncbi:hypothetical protein [Microbacterium hydrocarbonoxydans]|nr:hypothetical protein [Microbacterium hydrocarbonoxydans]SEC52435.1 hypothetical protein SAMN04489807_3472 [Microbacterium hydrocarbonoxydans]